MGCTMRSDSDPRRFNRRGCYVLAIATALLIAALAYVGLSSFETANEDIPTLPDGR